MRGKEFIFKTGSLCIPYSMSETSRGKNIRLIMDMNGFRVVKPSKAKLEEVEKLMKAKDSWICRHYLKFQSLKAEEYGHEWKSGETLLYKGTKYDILLLNYEGKTTKVSFDGNSFEVRVNHSLEENVRKHAIEAAFERWYRQAACETLRERLDYYSKVTGLSYSGMRIKEQKTRWGSCSKKGNLNFNWKLVMSPQWVIDYVIVHEMCHLKHLNHSKAYWNMVALYMPEYGKAREWLKKYGRELTL